MVDVVYSWMPSKCFKCGQLGHKASRCLGIPQKTQVLSTNNSIMKPTDGVHVSSAVLETASTIVLSVTEFSLNIALPAGKSNALPVSSSMDLPIIESTTIVDSIHVSATISTPIEPTIENVSITLVTLETVPPTFEMSTNIEPTAEVVKTTTKTASISNDALITPRSYSQLQFLLHLNLHRRGNNPLSVLGSAELMETSINSEEETLLDVVIEASNIDAIEAEIPATNLDFKDVETAPTDVEELVGEIGEINRFAAFETGIFSGYESFDATAQRSRGGRPFKPTQKLQDMHWTTVSRCGNRGRGGRGGRGPLN